MRYSIIELEALKTLAVTDVGDDCIEIIKQAAQKAFCVDTLTDRDMMTFLSNLYAKLHQDNLIKSRNQNGIVDFLNDMAAFRLNSFEKILSYIIGQMRGIRIPAN